MDGRRAGTTGSSTTTSHRSLRQEARRRERHEASKTLHEPWLLEAWPETPTRYLLCRDDRMFPPAWARRHARERLGIEPDEMDGGHYISLSRSLELSTRLAAYASRHAEPARSLRQGAIRARFQSPLNGLEPPAAATKLMRPVRARFLNVDLIRTVLQGASGSMAAKSSCPRSRPLRRCRPRG